MIERLKKDHDFRIILIIVMFCLTYLLSIRPVHCPENPVVQFKYRPEASSKSVPTSVSSGKLTYKITPLVHKGWSGAWPSLRFWSQFIESFTLSCVERRQIIFGYFDPSKENYRQIRDAILPVPKHLSRMKLG